MIYHAWNKFAQFQSHPPVATEWGDFYTEWTDRFIFNAVRRESEDTRLARSSWPLPWGRGNTGRAMSPNAQPALLIERDEKGVSLRAGSTPDALLESSEDLRTWQPDGVFPTRGGLKIEAKRSSRFYRMRQQ